MRRSHLQAASFSVVPREEPTFLRFRQLHRGSRLTILGSRVDVGTDTVSGRSLRAALFLLLLPQFSRLFLLPFGLTVITLVQRNLQWCAAHIGTCFRALYSALCAEPEGTIRHRDTKYAMLYGIVDVPVPAEPPLEVVMKSDRATRDQVTGLRFVGS